MLLFSPTALGRLLSEAQQPFAFDQHGIVLLGFAAVALLGFGLMIASRWRDLPDESFESPVLKEVTILKSLPSPKQV